MHTLSRKTAKQTCESRLCSRCRSRTETCKILKYLELTGNCNSFKYTLCGPAFKVSGDLTLPLWLCNDLDLHMSLLKYLVSTKVVKLNQPASFIIENDFTWLYTSSVLNQTHEHMTRHVPLHKRVSNSM